jgi:hypothetical protein
MTPAFQTMPGLAAVSRRAVFLRLADPLASNHSDRPIAVEAAAVAKR